MDVLHPYSVFNAANIFSKNNFWHYKKQEEKDVHIRANKLSNLNPSLVVAYLLQS